MQRERNLAPNPELTDSTNSQDKGDWTLVSAPGRRRNLSLPPEVSLCNRYDALVLEHEESMSNLQDPGNVNHAKLVQLPTRIRTGATRKVCRVLVMGDFFLRAPKGPFVIQTMSLEKFVHIRDVAERLPSLVKTVDYHLFLLFQAGSNDAAMR